MSAALYSPRNHEIPRSLFIRGYTEREDAEGREKFLKSGAGRGFLRAQLRHYLKRFPASVRASVPAA